MTIVGEIALWLAALFALWAILAGALGGATARTALVLSGRRGLPASTVMLMLATAGIVTALLRRDFELAYVAATSGHSLPTAYTIAALWSRPPGGALLLALPLAAAGAIVVTGALRPTTPWRVALVGIALLLCIAPLCFSSALYARLPGVAPDGDGLAPRMQSPYALVQPPLAALGYALMLPYLLARLSTLVVCAHDDADLQLARRVALLGWVVLGAAMLVALAWAYRDALWWDAWTMRVVHDGSLVAWMLTGACLLARGRRTGVMLAIVALAAVTLAVGVSPVPMFERALDPMRDGRGVLIGVATLALLALAARESGASAESEERPARASRARRAAAVAFAVAGCALVAVALYGQQDAVQHDVRIETGRTVALVDPRGESWQLVGQGVSTYQSRNRDVSALAVSLSRDQRGAGLLTAERWQALDRRGRALGEPVSVVGVRRGLAMDVRVLMAVELADGADARVRFEPFALMLWIGGTLLLVGGSLALFD